MEGFKSKLYTTEERIHELEYRPEENIQTSLQLQQDKKFRKYRKEPKKYMEPSGKIYVIRVLVGKERDKVA